MAIVEKDNKNNDHDKNEQNKILKKFRIENLLID